MSAVKIEYVLVCHDGDRASRFVPESDFWEVSGERDRYLAALQKIAESDYRGNCPNEIRLAQKALTPDRENERE